MNRETKIKLLELIKNGEMPINILSFKPGNYIRIEGSSNYHAMEGNKNIIYSYYELMELCNSEYFSSLTPSYMFNCMDYPFCITLVIR